MIDLQPDLELTADEAERLLEAWLGSGGVHGNPAARGWTGEQLYSNLTSISHHTERSSSSTETDEDTFAAEARALEYLGAETACPVPSVYLQDGSTRLIP